MADLDNSSDGDATATATTPPDDQPSPAKKKKTKKKETFDELKARVAALEAENKALKKNKKKTTAPATTNDDDDANTDLELQNKNKKETAIAKKGKKSQKQTPSSNKEKETAVDVSAWADFDLDSQILEALSHQGFSAPTHVQAECLPAAIRDRRDVIGAAQTGSGKTLAFGLPILHLLCGSSASGSTKTEEGIDKKLKALILAPTRELAMQVCDHLQVIGRRCGVWVVPIVGGISAHKQERLLNKHPEVVVATPGRLWDLMREGNPHVANLSGLRFLVIDEADRMVQQGHYAELTSIIDAIPGARKADKEEEEEEEEEEVEDDKKKKPANAAGMQTFVFSATLTLPGALRKRLRKGGGGASGSATLESLMDQIPFLGRGKPKVVDLTSDRKIADKISEAHISCPEAERDEYLYCLLVMHPGRTIVFVNAISSVRRLAAILKTLGLPVHPLHAEMQQRARLKALDRFREDGNAILVATDVAARGLDIKDVKCVVHYQLPASLDGYVHRSGRTARAEAEGVAIALVTPKENGRYRALLKALDRQEPPEFPLDVAVMGAARQRVRLAIRLDGLERKIAKERADTSWRRQNAEKLGIELSDDSEDDKVQGKLVGKKARKDTTKAPSNAAKEIESVKTELKALLSEPLQPKFSRKFFTGGAAAGVAASASGPATTTTTNSNGHHNNNTTSAIVSKAVEMATTSVAAGKKSKETTTGAKKKTSTKKMTRDQVLAFAVQKQIQKKSMKKKGGGRGMVVVGGQALGRASQGPDALQALRSRNALQKE